MIVLPDCLISVAVERAEDPAEEFLRCQNILANTIRAKQRYVCNSSQSGNPPCTLETTVLITSRLSVRRCKRLPRPADRLTACHCQAQTAILTACSRSDRRATKSRHFCHGDTAAHAIILPIKKCGAVRPRIVFGLANLAITPLPPPAPRCASFASPASGTGPAQSISQGRRSGRSEHKQHYRSP